METKSGYGYVRVSTDKQEELSPDSQEKLLREHAKKNNINLKKVFFEIGVSGRKAEKRPAFQEMIGLAKSKEHPVDVIIVWKFSRFARNQEESIVYKSLLKKQHNIDVISVSEPLIDGPFGSLIERIIEWMDEYYSIRLSGEVFRGMKENALRGNYQARPPLGYRIAERGKPPVIVPEEAEIIKMIFDGYVNQHKSIFSLAKELNTLGLKTSHGKEFERRSIEYILQNPAYCGMLRWNRTKNETNEIKSTDEWIITQGAQEPIISKELFDLAQERFKNTYRPKGSRPSATYKHWLSGLMKCPNCGRTMIVKNVYKKSANETYAYFVCYGYAKGKCLQSNSVSSRNLEPAVIASMQSVLAKNEIAFEYINSTESTDDTQEKLLNNQLYALQLKEKRIKEAYINGIDTIEEYKANKQALSKETESIQKLMTELKDKSDIELDKKNLLNKIKNTLEIIKSADQSNAKKNEVLKSIISKIVYIKESDTIKISYYICQP